MKPWQNVIGGINQLIMKSKSTHPWRIPRGVEQVGILGWWPPSCSPPAPPDLPRPPRPLAGIVLESGVGSRAFLRWTSRPPRCGSNQLKSQNEVKRFITFHVLIPFSFKSEAPERNLKEGQSPEHFTANRAPEARPNVVPKVYMQITNKNRIRVFCLFFFPVDLINGGAKESGHVAGDKEGRFIYLCHSAFSALRHSIANTCCPQALQSFFWSSGFFC